MKHYNSGKSTKPAIILTNIAGIGLACCIALLIAATAFAAESESASDKSDDQMGDLAKKLQNPVASLIQVPFQNNFDFGGGPNDEGFQYELKIQPVIPIKLNDCWNVITRTIVPYIYQEDRIGTGSQSGLSDTTMSLFLSPTNTAPFIWGIGPDFYFPTATRSDLGAEKWGLGPTAVVLRQDKGWTFGMLANQIWSYAGHEDRERISSAFLQPFLNYTTKKHTTFGANTESTYDWVHHQWTVPINVFVQQLIKVGKLPVNLEFGGRYYADKPSGGPDWGLRFQMTLVLPR
jgi:hypothetical protein